MFEVGDVVVCVDARINHLHPDDTKQLVKNKIYRVSSVGKPTVNYLSGEIDKPVHLVGVSVTNPNGFGAFRFRKLPPAEPEFTSLIRSLGVPKRVREDA